MGSSIGRVMGSVSLTLLACGGEPLPGSGVTAGPDGSPAPDVFSDDAGGGPSPPTLGAGGSVEVSPPTVEVDAASVQDAGASVQDAAAAPSSDPRLPTNVSFETALRVEVDAPPVLQDVMTGDQVDFFSFEGIAGKYYALTTDRAPFTPDNLIALYDPERRLIAESDDGSRWPGDSIDARIVIRLPKDGTYYARVEDQVIPDEVFSGPSPPLVFYHFGVEVLEAGTKGIAHASAGAAAAISFARDQRFGYSYVTLLGAFQAGRSDTFTFAGGSEQVLFGRVLASGPKGNGSTALSGAIRVDEHDDGHALAFISRAAGQERFNPPVSTDSYDIRISAEGDAGGNDFYVVELALVPDNPREQAESANGMLEGAETLAMDGIIERRGLLLATLAAADVDYFGFEARDGEAAEVYCEAESGGSGVRGLRAELRDASDLVLGSAAETVNANLELGPVPLPAAGTYYLRLSSGSTEQAPLAEPWVRCGIYVSP